MDSQLHPAQRTRIPPFSILALDATLAAVNFVAPLLGQIVWFIMFFTAIAVPLDANNQFAPALELRLAGVLLSVPAGVLVARVLGHWLLEGIVVPELCYWRMRLLEEDAARWIAEQKASSHARSSTSGTVLVSETQGADGKVISGEDEPIRRSISPVDSLHDLSPFEEMERQDLIRQWQAGL
ncbi:unnamed protein product [Peniophora sp. CBMAI 1063]|nr:unnamed protein product [Peniophora sp. CBMAI 1063]